MNFLINVTNTNTHCFLQQELLRPQPVKKILESKAVKDAATQGMASVMAVRKDAEETFQDMRENAEEIVIDAHEENKKEIYVEADE